MSVRCERGRLIGRCLVALTWLQKVHSFPRADLTTPQHEEIGCVSEVLLSRATEELPIRYAVETSPR